MVAAIICLSIANIILIIMLSCCIDYIATQHKKSLEREKELSDAAMRNLHNYIQEHISMQAEKIKKEKEDSNWDD